MTATTPDKQVVNISESADGRRRSLRAAGAPAIAAEYDSGGRLEKLSEDGGTALQQRWRPDGQPVRVETAAQAASFQYDDHDLLSSVVLSPPEETGDLKRWQETKFDPTGRPTGIRDSRGLDVALGYDPAGAVASVVQKTKGGNYGYTIKRDDQGRVQTVDSSWGNIEYAYGREGDLQRITNSRDGRAALIQLKGGNVQRVVDFDGGETTFTYHQEGDRAGMLEEVASANGLKLKYDYDEAGRLTEVVVGAERRVKVAYDERGRMVEYSWKPTGK